MYRSVVAQQGRVTLEADANEAEEIRAGEARAALIDVIGPTGSPDDGYHITVPAGLGDYDVAIGAGVIYVGGVRVETSATTYLKQQAGDWADYERRSISATDLGQAPVDPEPYPTANRRELFYLEVIEQEVSAVEDPALREVAIGGPDTSARTRMLRRVHRYPVQASSCEDAFTELWPALTGARSVVGPTTHRPRPARRPLPLAFGFDAVATARPIAAPVLVAGNLGPAALVPMPAAPAAAAIPAPTSQRVVPATRLSVAFVPGANAPDPCQPAAQTGFLGVENQLVRVQIGAGGTAFLWGYDNASFLYRAAVKAGSPSELKLHADPVDTLRYPRPNQWVELLITAVVLDDDGLVASRVGRPVQVASYDPTDRTLTLQGDTTGLPNELFVRVWENRQAIVGGPIELVGADNLQTGVQVTITGTAFAGDHWLIGVRPGVAADDASAIYPARLRTPQPPDGPHRWVVPLAVADWHDAHTATVSDCRKPFRPLTEDDDLAFHNQHLHGWGVVCGLQVTCPPLTSAGNIVRPEETVIVRDGYAIHPSGHDIRLRTVDGETRVALGDLAVSAGVLKRDNGKVADGAVSLWIDQQKRFHVDPYDPAHKTGWLERLRGTMLWDVLTDCALPLWSFLQSQLVPAPGEGLVGPATRRRIALTNLLWQVAAAYSPVWDGKRIYLSGAPGPQDLTEDKILRDLFEELKSRLAPQTFCAMFDDVVYPDYDVYRAALPPGERRPTTIFGTGRHQRVRINELRQLAFTCGGDDRVNIYDLTTYQFLDSVVFPIVGAEIKDVAFSRDGNDLYAIAETTTNDSVFAQGALGADKKLQWRASPPLPVPGVLATLAVDHRGTIFATVIGKGIFQLIPGANPQFEPRFQFVASGHLAAGSRAADTVLYAGRAAQQGALEFVQVLGLSVDSGEQRYFELPAVAGKPGVGRDDLAAFGKVDTPHAIVDGDGGTRRLLSWDPDGAVSLQDPGAPPKRNIDLGPSAASRIAFDMKTQTAMITYYDLGEARPYRFGDDQLGAPVHPLQIGPIAIAAAAATNAFYAFNLVSGTLTYVPATREDSTIDLPKLEAYRRAAIAAYMKLVGRLVQFLKDCLCQHLLIQCPDGEGKVYLADINFKDGKVYQICNFGRRKYVHSFPTVEYWMSLVPIIPLVREQIEKVCCAVITDWFDALAVPPDAKLGDTVPKASARAGLGFVLGNDLGAEVKTRKAQLDLGRNLARAVVVSKLRPPIPEAPKARAIDPSIGPEIDNPVPDNMRNVLEGRGLAVRRTEVIEPRMALEMLTARPAVRGETVDMVTDIAGRVIGTRRVAPETAPSSPVTAPAPATPVDEVATLRRQLDELHTRLAALEARGPHR